MREVSIAEMEGATWPAPESGPQLTARKWGPQSYDHQKMSSANNLKEFEHRSFSS